jgi:hypothetical protein
MDDVENAINVDNFVSNIGFSGSGKETDSFSSSHGQIDIVVFD